MKKVLNVVNVAPDVIVPNINKYYGIELDDGARCFVTRNAYRGGDYRVLCSKQLTEGNSVCNLINKTSLFDILQSALSNKYKVYEFDTPQELFRWVGTDVEL